MSPEYPAFRCLFCHKMFGSRKAVYDHFDHFIPEYCQAYNVKIRQQGNAYHPLAILRYIRSDINRNREILWELDPTVIPMEGVPWNFAIPVPDKAARDASLREGYHTASWWIDRLCQPRVAPTPPPPAPPAARVAGHLAGSVAGNFSRSVAGAIQAAVNGDINANIIDAHRQDAFEDESDHDTPPRRARHRSRRVPAPLTPVRRPVPRRVRFSPSPARAPQISPFMRPAAPLVATILHIRFFGHVYPVSITRRMDIDGAMAALKQLVPGEWDVGTWAMFGIAPEEAGEAWVDAEWVELKRKWIEKAQGTGEKAWVVMKV